MKVLLKHLRTGEISNEFNQSEYVEKFLALYLKNQVEDGLKTVREALTESIENYNQSQPDFIAFIEG